MTELGTIPQVGDRCVVAGVRLEVIQMMGRRAAGERCSARSRGRR